MTGHTVILSGRGAIERAKRLIDQAPQGAVVNVRAARRTSAQNDRMWALLSDVSRAKPEGRCHTPEVWKALFMQACGHAVQFEHGLNGQPFPTGFRSSRLSKEEMGELMNCIEEYGSRHNVVWSDEAKEKAA